MISFIVGFVVGAVLSVLLLRHKSSTVNKLNESRHLKKEERKKQIMGLFDSKSHITNDDVENFLNVSDRTTTRYLRELEKEGRIVQHGKTRGSYYTKN